MKNEKTILLRVPKETWVFLKKVGIKEETKMAPLVVKLIEDYKKKYKKDLDSL